MSKMSTFLKALSKTQQTLALLDGVVDVDRLIGISNAQGPQAKLIRAILDFNQEDFDGMVGNGMEAVSVGEFLDPDRHAELRSLSSKRKKRKTLTARPTHKERKGVSS